MNRKLALIKELRELAARVDAATGMNFLDAREFVEKCMEAGLDVHYDKVDAATQGSYAQRTFAHQDNLEPAREVLYDLVDRLLVDGKQESKRRNFG